MINPSILSTAFVSLILGLLIHFLRSHLKQLRDEGTNIIAWVLIALFPVLVLFSFFPDSSLSGAVAGVSFSGAFGAFIVLLRIGIAGAIPRLRADLDASEEQVNLLEEQLKTSGIIPAHPIRETRVFLYRVLAQPDKHIGLVTGDIANVGFASIWVNSENTNMQMSRFYEGTVSATIRYLGAVRDELGEVQEDLVAQELARVMEGRTSVAPGRVVVTGSGELARTNGVRHVYHAASVQGQRLRGYRQIENVEECVTQALARAEQEEWGDEKPRSILFPLLGVHVGRGNLKSTAGVLIDTAIDYLSRNGTSAVDIVYFLAFTDVELTACKDLLDAKKMVSFVSDKVPFTVR